MPDKDTREPAPELPANETVPAAAAQAVVASGPDVVARYLKLLPA